VIAHDDDDDDDDDDGLLISIIINTMKSFLNSRDNNN
jgi:hypothetical protein